MLEGKTTIIHEELIDLSSVDFTDEEGFFFHCTTGGAIKYCAFKDADADFVTKTFDASDSYIRPVFARKIFKTGTAASGIYAGKAI